MLPDLRPARLTKVAVSPARRVLASLFGREAAGINAIDAAKEAARKALRHAVRTGSITKPCACQSCGKSVAPHELHGHHNDYARALDVDWLCAQCHRATHAGQPHLHRKMIVDYLK
jgi:hypothetical protein